MLFEIKDIKCQYDKNKPPVLIIEQLDINHGDIVFFVGASGTGKSTILETLGLMNLTIQDKSHGSFSFNLNNYQNENFLKIWNKGDTYLSKIRKNHFSFIFQNTNLFSTLTPFENTLLTSLLQKDTTEIEAAQRSRSLIQDKVFYDKKEWRTILNKKKIFDISGGQRQRLSFVRAIAAKYDVLFADEPTGNLDVKNARNVMRVLMNDISEKKNATLIIVSHDINLSVEFANKIVFIDRIQGENDHTYGYINNKNIYQKNQQTEKWHTLEKEIKTRTLLSNDELIKKLTQKINNA